MSSNEEFNDIQDKLRADVKAASAEVWTAAARLPREKKLNINAMAPELGKALGALDVAFRLLFMSATAEPEESGD